jgi:hypothetical protein
VPEDRALALQTGFAATQRDRDYLAEAAAFNVSINAVSAADIYRAIDKLSRASPKLFDYVRKLVLEKKGG